MAGKKENIKALFSNTRTRVIIIFTLTLLIATVVIGVVKMRSYNQRQLDSASKVKRVPVRISSIPGSQNQTAQYATLQNTQNIEQAEAANKSGASAIPTIIKTQAFGDGVDLIGPQYGEGGVGFTTLSRSNLEGDAKSLWTQQLETDHCSNAAIKDVVDKGATLSDLRESCTCCQLRQYGYTLSDLDPVCACPQLKAAGFTAREMKAAGYTAGKLKRCGFSACEVRGGGFSAQDMKDGGFTDGELKGAGFSDESIEAAGGLPPGVSLDDVRSAGCDPEKLARLREKGVSAATIQRISGCSAAQLKAAGFSADDLRRAGFSAADLKAAGFSPEELKKAGYSARELLNAGFSPNDLKQAGFSDEEIKKGTAALPPGVTLSQLKKAGCSVETLKRERLAGVSAEAIRQSAGCNAAALKAAGFTDEDLRRAGFNPADDKTIRAAGCDPKKLRALRATGVSAKKIRELNGCSAAQLKAAGFGARELADAGLTPEELLSAGFSPDALRLAGVSPVDEAAIRQVGCDAEQLKALRKKGVSAKQIHDLNGCSAEQLKAAGFDAKELADAGFTPAELLKAGFDSGALNSAGLIPSSVIAAGREKGCDVEELKAAKKLGVSAATIRETLGCSAAAMRAAGYAAQELKDAGYSAADLKNAGFSAKELKDAGYSAQALKDAGFSAKELKDAGYSAQELSNAGYSADALKAAGVTDAELKAIGVGDDAKKAASTAATGAAASAGEAKAEDAVDKSSITKLPPIPSTTKKDKAGKKASSDTKQLQELMSRQQSHISEQRYQAKVKQLSGRMISAANQALQGWKSVPTQVFILGSTKEGDEDSDDSGPGGLARSNKKAASSEEAAEAEMPPKETFIKTGDILFAVLDTSVNTDEPGPILATIVSGKLKGSKLIGSFTLPANADKMVVTFNTLSMLGADKTIGISAYAIDPNTARTALASRVNHHYLMRYGSLFASTFLAGFSSAIQSADTTITIGGTGGTTDTTVQNGINRSLLENALIGLGEVGKAWSETAQELMNRPTTIELFSGTGMGVLFTQDVQIA
ncbi:MAG: type IVB secretion system protein DotG/IcmE [Legionellaceae bacterium]|nr:type IVB secretion system protein DotG/IcmE [Legionellaceae bacterium]